VNIDQRATGKGGKTFNAIDQAYGLRVVKREHTERLRARRQFFDEMSFCKVTERRGATGQILRVSVQQQQQCTGMFMIAVVGPANAKLGNMPGGRARFGHAVSIKDDEIF